MLASFSALEFLNSLPRAEITHIPLAIYSCLPPTRSGIADATWDVIYDFAGPFHVFASLPRFIDFAKLQHQLARSDQRVLPVESASSVRKYFEYGVHLFVLETRCTISCRSRKWSAYFVPGAGIVTHFHEPQMTQLWSDYLDNDLEALKSLYILHYPEHALGTTRDSSHVEDIVKISRS